MRVGLASLVGLLLATEPVRADDLPGPGPGPGPGANRCEVAIVRAPDDVRAEIEAWVHAEPRCATSMEVRVVPTDGGLYLFARDHHGYTRERVVPDGPTAGALVASWIADDDIDGRWLPEQGAGELHPPGMQDAMPVVAATVAPRRPSRGFGFVVGGYAGANSEGPIGGARLDLELPLGARSPTGSAWQLIGSLGLGGASFYGDTDQRYIHVEAHEARATLGIGRLWSSKHWQVRARASLLVRLMRRTVETIEWASPSDSMWSGPDPGALVGGEVALAVGRKLGAHWSILAGPILGKAVGGDGLPNASYAAELTIYGGLGYTR